MSRKDTEAMRNLYVESTHKPMTVGNTKPGDLEGYTKEKGPKGSGPESTDAKKAEEAPEELQGDTVEKSKGKKKGGSRFDELYQRAIKEDLESSNIESSAFDSEAGDFPPAGEEEADAELGGEEDMEEAEGDSFSQLADLFSKAADLFSKMASEHGSSEEGMISDETPIEGDEFEEAVESEPAPDGVAKMTNPANKNVNGVKVVKKTAESGSKIKAEGTPKKAKDTTLGPNTPLKANGSGSAVEGKGASAFE